MKEYTDKIQRLPCPVSRWARRYLHILIPRRVSTLPSYPMASPPLQLPQAHLSVIPRTLIPNHAFDFSNRKQWGTRSPVFRFLPTYVPRQEPSSQRFPRSQRNLCLADPISTSGQIFLTKSVSRSSDIYPRRRSSASHQSQNDGMKCVLMVSSGRV